MEFEKLLRMRQSTRKYQKKQIPQEDLEKIIDAANRAPVGSNLYQDVHLTVVQDQNVLLKLCEAACAYIATKKPRLAAFVYDDPDHVGHKYGHDTPEYYEKLKELDAWVGAIVDAIDQAGILDKSVIILTSDHGGIDHGHGGRTMMEMETPLILYGKGVKKGHCFDDLSVMEYDIASTMAWLLDLQQPQPWFGRPLTSLFEH